MKIFFSCKKVEGFTAQGKIADEPLILYPEAGIFTDGSAPKSMEDLVLWGTYQVLLSLRILPPWTGYAYRVLTLSTSVHLRHNNIAHIITILLQQQKMIERAIAHLRA